MDPKLTQILVCPFCKGPLLYDKKKKDLFCKRDKKAFSVIDEIPDLVPDEARDLSDEELEQKLK